MPLTLSMPPLPSHAREQKDGLLTLRDLKRCKLSGNFFNILFNLNKFVAFETRDPFLIRQVIGEWVDRDVARRVAGQVIGCKGRAIEWCSRQSSEWA